MPQTARSEPLSRDYRRLLCDSSDVLGQIQPKLRDFPPRILGFPATPVIQNSDDVIPREGGTVTRFDLRPSPDRRVGEPGTVLRSRNWRLIKDDVLGDLGGGKVPTRTDARHGKDIADCVLSLDSSARGMQSKCSARLRVPSQPAACAANRVLQRYQCEPIGCHFGEFGRRGRRLIWKNQPYHDQRHSQALRQLPIALPMSQVRLASIPRRLNGSRDCIGESRPHV